jgi:hypothetical protein
MRRQSLAVMTGTGCAGRDDRHLTGHRLAVISGI